jgi:hypothetical protein
VLAVFGAFDDRENPLVKALIVADGDRLGAFR